MATQEVSRALQRQREPLSSVKNKELSDLPEDCILELLYHLDVIAIIAFQSTCRRIYGIAKHHSVWSSAFYRISDTLRIPLSLERPVSSYSAAELQNRVIRFASVDRNWTKTAPVPTSICDLAWPLGGARLTKLVLNGRWLLIATSEGSIFSVDLDAPAPSLTLLIPKAMGHPQMADKMDRNIVHSMCADSEFLSIDMAIFCVAMTIPYPTFPIHVNMWRVSFDLTSNSLSARRIHSFQAQGPVITPALRWNLICWAGSYKLSVFIKVFDWERCSQDVTWTCSINYVGRRTEPEDIHIIPGNRLLVLQRGLMVILDIPKLVPYPPTEIPIPTDATQLWTFDSYTCWGLPPNISHPVPWTHTHNRYPVTLEHEEYLHLFMIQSDSDVAVESHTLVVREFNGISGISGVCRPIWRDHPGTKVFDVRAMEDLQPWSTMRLSQVIHEGMKASDHHIEAGTILSLDLPGYFRDGKYFQFDEHYGRIAFYRGTKSTLRILDFA